MKTIKTIKLTKTEVTYLLKKENLLPFNRKITQKHAMSILESISAYGVLKLPVVARLGYKNNILAIADGQHTITGIETIMRKKDVIECIVVDCKTKKEVVDLIARLNTTAKSWGNQDFLDAWIKFGADNEHYSKYELIHNRLEQSKISLANILSIFVKKDGSFKKGNINFVDNPVHANLVYKLAKHFVLNYKTSAFPLVGVITFVQSHPNFEDSDIESFILRANRYFNSENKYPKGREEMKSLLETINDSNDLEFSKMVND
jgi:hypothetical protein